MNRGLPTLLLIVLSLIPSVLTQQTPYCSSNDDWRCGTCDPYGGICYICQSGYSLAYSETSSIPSCVKFGTTQDYLGGSLFAVANFQGWIDPYPTYYNASDRFCNSDVTYNKYDCQDCSSTSHPIDQYENSASSLTIVRQKVNWVGYCGWGCYNYSEVAYTSTSGPPPQKALCEGCANVNCYTCSSASTATGAWETDPPNTKCKECKITHKRFNTLATAVTAISSNGNDACNNSKTIQFVNRTYYLSPSCGNACSATDTPSPSSPCCDFNQMAYEILNELNDVVSANITIYFIRKTTDDSAATQTFYILENNSTSTTLIPNDFSILVKRVFERANVQVTMLPLLCGDPAFDAYCFAEGNSPVLRLKSHSLNFFVSKSLTIQNVIIDGSDLINTDSSAPCYSNTGYTTPCSGTARTTAEPPGNYTTVHGMDSPNGFFQLQFLTDAPETVPTLTLTNVTVNNFYNHYYFKSFIAFDGIGGKVVLSNCNFNTFFMPYGLIASSFTKYDRNYHFHTTKVKNCQFYNSGLSECFSLYIHDSSFINYNYNIQSSTTQKFTESRGDQSAIRNEGMVLFLDNIDGPVEILGSKFQNMRSFANPPYPNLTSAEIAADGITVPDADGDCGDFMFQTTYNGDISYGGSFNHSNVFGPIDEQVNEVNPPTDPARLALAYNTTYPIHFRSSYKHHLDKHLRRYLEWPISATSSVLHLRNMTGGLTISDCTFDSNVGLTGTALYLNGFETSSNYYWLYISEYNCALYKLGSKGIAIINNMFTNNFAKVMGSSIIITKVAEDVTLMGCTGCVNTLGNVILSCEGSPLRSGYSGSFTKFSEYYSTTFSIVEDSGQTMTSGSTPYLTKFSQYMKRVSDKSSISTLNNLALSNGTTLSAILDPNKLLIKSNTFTNNAALISNALYIQGFHDVQITDCTFSDNGVPYGKYIDITSPNFQANAYYKLISSARFYSQTLNGRKMMGESSPVHFKNGAFVSISNCDFSNNVARFQDDLQFGGAITFYEMLARNISITDTKITDYYGWNLATEDPVNGVFNYNIFPLISLSYYSSFLSMYTPSLFNDYTAYDLIFGINAKNTIFSNIALSFTYTADSTDTSNVYSVSTYLKTLNSWWQSEYRQFSFILNFADTNKFYQTLSNANLLQFEISSSTFYNISDYTGQCLLNPFYGTANFTGNSFESITVSTLIPSSLTPTKPTQESPIAIALICDPENAWDSVVSSKFTLASNIFSDITGPVLFFGAGNGGNMTMASPRVYVYDNSIQRVTVAGNYNAVRFYKSATIVFKQNTFTEFVTESPAFYIDASENALSGVSQIYFQNNIFSYLNSTVTDNFGWGKISGSAVQIAFTSNTFQNLGFNQSTQYTSYYETASLISSEPSSSNNLSCIILLDTATVTFTGDSFSSLTFPLFIYQSGGQATFNEVTFSGNKQGFALLVSVQSGTTTISDSTFTDNECQLTNCTGGLIYASSVTMLSILSSTFTNNKADYSPIMDVNSSTLFINASTFSNNKALAQSVFSTKLAVMTISYSTFSNNVASSGSGAISADIPSSLFFTSCTFSGNQATLGTNLLSVTKAQSTATLTSCTFTESIVTAAQYSFLTVFDSPVQITSCTFTNGQASVSAISSDSNRYFLNITSSTFQGCIYESSTGSAVYSKSPMTITSCTFKGNKGNIASDIYSEGEALYIISSTFTGVLSGASVYITSSTLEISDSTFDGTTSGSASDQHGVICALCESATITNSNFKNLYSTSVGYGAVSISYSSSYYSSNVVVKITGSTFDSNWALNGSAIYLHANSNSYIKATLSGNSIQNNYADFSGGGIYWDCPNTNCDLTISSTTMTNNSARYEGGAITFTKAAFTDNGITYSYNSAPYGPDKACYPIKLKIIEDPSKSIYSAAYSSSRRRLYEVTQGSVNVSNLVSGESGEDALPPIVIGLYDEFDQQVHSDNTSILTVSMTSMTSYSLSISQGSSIQAINGYYIFYDFLAVYYPASYAKASVTSSSLLYMNTTYTSRPFRASSFYFDPYLVFYPYFRNCSRGERFSTDGTMCSACPAGYYTVDPSFKGYCYQCNETLECDGGDRVAPIAGYSRLDGWAGAAIECVNTAACLGKYNPDNTSNSTNSTSSTRRMLTTVPNITEDEYYCKESYNSTYCLTGWCEKGYWGNLCASCISGWAKSQSKYCVKCSNNASYWVLLVLMIIGAGIFLIYTIRNALKSNEKIAAGTNDKTMTTVLIRILMNYLQLVSIVASFNFDWPDQIEQFFSVQDTVSSSSSQIFSMDCIIQAGIGDSMSPFFAKLIVIALSPIMIALVCTMVWAMIYLKRHWKKICKHKSSLRMKVVTSIVILIFTLYTTILQTSILGFRCKNLRDTDTYEYYLENDLEIQCWQSTHLKWVFMVALPSLIFWGLGIPVFAFWLLRKNQNDLTNPEFQKKYGFLYDGYSRVRYYWEFVVLYRKLFMIFISVFMVAYGVQLQALSVLGVSFVSLLAHIWGQPYSDRALNSMETKALVSATITLYCGVYFTSGSLPSAVNWVFFFAIVAINVVFFGHWIRVIIRANIEFLGKLKFVGKIFHKIAGTSKSKAIVVPEEAIPIKQIEMDPEANPEGSLKNDISVEKPDSSKKVSTNNEDKLQSENLFEEMQGIAEAGDLNGNPSFIQADFTPMADTGMGKESNSKLAPNQNFDNLPQSLTVDLEAEAGGHVIRRREKKLESLVNADEAFRRMEKLLNPEPEIIEEEKENASLRHEPNSQNEHRKISLSQELSPKGQQDFHHSVRVESIGDSHNLSLASGDPEAGLFSNPGVFSRLDIRSQDILSDSEDIKDQSRRHGNETRKRKIEGIYSPSHFSQASRSLLAGKEKQISAIGLIEKENRLDADESHTFSKDLSPQIKFEESFQDTTDGERRRASENLKEAFEVFAETLPEETQSNGQVQTLANQSQLSHPQVNQSEQEGTKQEEL